MRILLANKFFRPGAGAETAFLATRQILQEAGHEVIDFAMAEPESLDSPYSRFFAPNRSYGQAKGAVRRSRDALASIYSPDARKAIRRLISEARPDVAHLHNVYHQLTLSIIDELSAQSIPTVMTLHDYKIVCPSYTLFTGGDRCRRCVDGHAFHAVRHRCIKGSAAASTIGSVEATLTRTRKTYQKLDALIAPSSFIGELAATRVPPSRVHVLTNFLPLETLEPPVPSVDREPIILFAGRLDVVKGIQLLLKAFRERAGDGLRLVIAGDGPLRDEVACAARQTDQIDYLGRLASAAVTERMRSARAVIVPSIWEENCPMTILEARAAGTPVICSDSGGIPELVDHGVDGILFDPGSKDSLLSAVARFEGSGGDAILDAMASAGQQRFLRRHSPRSHLDGLLEIYTKATAASRVPVGETS